MSNGIATVLLAMASMAYFLLLAGSNSVSAQNMTNQTIVGTNASNVTTSDSSSSAKLHLGEAIKALENGDKAGASTHLTAAQQTIAGASPQAKMHFEEGMKAISAGDSNGALMHLKAAIQALG